MNSLRSVIYFLLLFIISCFLITSLTSSETEAFNKPKIGGYRAISDGDEKAIREIDYGDGLWNTIFRKYRYFTFGFLGIGTITCVGIFIIKFIQLGASAGNPRERSQAISGLVCAGIGVAGFGAVILTVGLLYGTLK